VVSSRVLESADGDDGINLCVQKNRFRGLRLYLHRSMSILIESDWRRLRGKKVTVDAYLDKRMLVLAATAATHGLQMFDAISRHSVLSTQALHSKYD
jgi:hypothetical protein